MRAILLVLILTGAVAGVAGAQTAAPSKTDLDKAKAHFKAGEAFFSAGVFDRAINEYEAAYALTMRAPLLYNLGSAYRRLGEESGKLEDKRAALDFYEKYLASDPNGKVADEARRWVGVLRPEIEKLEAEEKARPPAPPSPEEIRPPVAPAPAPATAADRPRKSKKTVRIVGYATAGAGAVLLGTGVFFGMKAKGAADDLDAIQAGGMWDQDLYDSGKSYERNALILGGVGAAAIAGGLVTALVFGRDREAPATVAVTPAGTLVVAGRF